jgi:[protein-PII] uridylyltransferase
LFSQGLENTVNKDDRIADKKDSARDRLRSFGLKLDQITDVWEHTSDEYFVRESIQNIVWHSRAIALHTSDSPLVSIKEVTDSNGEIGATQVFIYTRNADFLFANSTAAFEKLNLNIQGARIFTSNNDYCMDTYSVLEDSGLPVGNNPRRRAEIEAVLGSYLLRGNRGRKAVALAAFRKTRKEKYFTKSVQVSLINPPNRAYSTLEINCPDQPGILACVGQVFADYSINLKDARITTLGERVEDLFFITDKHDKPITSSEFSDQLQEDIKAKLETHFRDN